MDFNVLKDFLTQNREPSYRFSQITSDTLSGRVSEFKDIFTIPQALRDKLEQNVTLCSVTPITVSISKDKNAYKSLLRLPDGEAIETVLLNPAPHTWSVCLSCQVGCAMGCAFCATGKQGLTRNLSAEEICDQILFWKQYITANKLKIRISNIVYMGMGEPFTNTENVFESLSWLTDQALYGFGQRHISVSTCGIVPGIDLFSQRFPQVNLAISLHASNDELRNKLMPVSKQFSLEQLMDSVRNYVTRTNRQVFFEYIMLDKINDTDKHGVELGNLLASYFKGKMHLIHVNLIPYNATGSAFVGSQIQTIKRYSDVLRQFHISSTVRRSLGQDVTGACGQLRGKLQTEN